MGVVPFVSLIISFAGVALVAALLNQPHSAPSGSEYGLYVWALFSTLNLLGASATLFPHACGRTDPGTEDLDTQRASMLLGVRIVHGHHPICDGFQGHEFTVSGKTFCASCLGLLIGASAALVTATMRFVFGFTYHPATAFIGIGCVVLGLTYAPLLRTDMPILRSIFNVGLVTGFALLLAVADEVGGLELDLLVIGICVFWMFTRIQLSNWEHDRICRGCGYGCEIKED